MTAIAVADLSKPRDPNAARWVGIGGGDLPAILGWSTRHTRWSLYQRKIGVLPRDPDNAFMADGRRMEKVIAEWWADNNIGMGDTLLDAHRIYRHEEHSWAVAAVDRFIAPVGVDINLDRPWWPTLKVWEAKSVYDPIKGRELLNGDIPPEFWVQVQWYLMVCDLEEAVLACKIGPDYVALPITRDRAAGADLLAVAAQFWRHVEERDPPEMGVDNPAIDLDAIARIYPDADNDLKVALSDEALEALAAYRAKRAAMAELDAEAKACRLVVEAEMGSAGVGTDHTGKQVVTWKQARPSLSFDMGLWQKKAPKAANRARERYRVERPGVRRFVAIAERDTEGN